MMQDNTGKVDSVTAKTKRAGIFSRPLVLFFRFDTCLRIGGYETAGLPDRGTTQLPNYRTIELMPMLMSRRVQMVMHMLRALVSMPVHMDQVALEQPVIV